ncbi:MAG: valine--tRNA ligase [Myxococcales bacterium]|nr:valine--tRNA ligase [Myxococcales bacterium]
MTSEMAKEYDPRACEPKWYAQWEQRGFFTASGDPGDDRTPYTIAIPPFNVTGSLHMGHACRITFEDVLIRYHRMLGRNALWLPGTDHAGIATQMVVERQLARDGLTKHDLGREAFEARVWQWKEESGGRILEQLRVLGASCDWTREKFTLAPDLSRAVIESFVRLYHEGLIYRDTRLISWCVKCATALSDLEVENEEGASGELFDFAYPVEGGGELVVSTTRPETMLGDTAVAVHPDDPRYKALIGKHVLHPFVERRIPIIGDAELVDMEFGTGAVKVTPAHDPNDFATGKRHALEQINILELDGKLNAEGGPFAGMDRFEARKAVKQALEDKGLTRGSKTHEMTKPLCHRCASVVEPMISTQWFCKMKPLAEPAIAAVEDGRTRIIPGHWEKTYFHWMRNIEDWCISRQLWWGHAIPAYYCSCGELTVAAERPASCAHCGKPDPRPDPDVLDTWFSSALWPFSTLGWPDQSADLKRFYPTDDMETGSDILFFWVARMMMMGLHFMGEVPFSRVLLSGMVTDERGQKMSKVKGNVIDPLDVVHGATLEELLDKARDNGAAESGIKYLQKTYPEGFPAYGADALRFTLLSYSPQTPKIALSIKRIEGYRNFGNKLWNAARFGLMQLQGSDARAGDGRPKPTALPNRWILSRLADALDAAHKGIADYRLDDASQALYHFVWGELCDWYLELTKPLLSADVAQSTKLAQETRATLAHVLETSLRALHPMMPFLTEEIWQRLPRPEDGPPSIMLAPYPRAETDAARDPELDQEMARLQAVIVAARTVRAEHDLQRKRIPLQLRAEAGAACDGLTREQNAIATLCNADVSVTADDGGPLPDNAAVSVAEGVTVIVPLAGLVDPAKERQRLERELKKLDKDLTTTLRKLENPKFVDRAPAEVVEQEKQRKRDFEDAKARLEAALAKLA